MGRTEQNESETPNSSRETIEELLSLGREIFGMEVAFFSEFVDGRQVYRGIGGDAEHFGLREGASIPLEVSYCQRVIDGRLPNLIPDAKNDERVNRLDVTHDAGIGSYMGVPIRLSDGRLYGTLCCLSRAPAPWLNEHEVELLKRFTRDVTRLLEREGVV